MAIRIIHEVHFMSSEKDSENGKLLRKIVSQNNSIIKKLNEMAKVNEEVKAIVSDIDAATTKVAEKLEKAISDFENGTVTEETIASLRAQAERLKGLGADPENPVPVDPEEPSDEEPVEPTDDEEEL